MATADMLADNPGTWMIHCHVADHINAGMMGRYTITPRSGGEPGVGHVHGSHAMQID